MQHLHWQKHLINEASKIDKEKRVGHWFARLKLKIIIHPQKIPFITQYKKNRYFVLHSTRQNIYLCIVKQRKAVQNTKTAFHTCKTTVRRKQI